jgi:hypothetical protein
MTDVISEVIKEYTGAVVRDYDRMLSEMLMCYKINILDMDEVRRRVSVIEMSMGKKKHFYVDGLYAFTITSFTRTEDDWGVNGNYRLGISHKIEFVDSMIGHRIKEEVDEERL